MQEGKIYFSGKHKLYGYKAEVCVMLTSIATAFNKHYPVSIHEFTIFNKRHHVHKRRLAKINEEDQYIDEYTLSDKYPDQWAVLSDKAYNGGQELCRVIAPFKKPNNEVLLQEEEDFNCKLSADLIIVENYFERMGKLWSLLHVKCMWRK